MHCAEWALRGIGKHSYRYFRVLTGNAYRYIKMSNNVNKFKYFAYGSNLLKERIHINNPSAEKVDIGRVDVSTYSGSS